MGVDETLLVECYRVARGAARRLRYVRSRGMPGPDEIAGDAIAELLSLDSLDCTVPKAVIAFAAQIARNLAVNRYRSTKCLKADVGRTLRLTEQDAELRPCRDPTAAEVAEANETRRRLFAGLDSRQHMFLKLKEVGESTEVAARFVGWHRRKAQRFLVDLSARLEPSPHRRSASPVRPACRPGTG